MRCLFWLSLWHVVVGCGSSLIIVACLFVGFVHSCLSLCVVRGALFVVCCMLVRCVYGFFVVCCWPA